MRNLSALPVATVVASSPAFSMGTAFTFQGSLDDGGAPAIGAYDLRFRLVNPSAQQFGPALEFDDVAVVGGVFTIELDFGPNVLSGFERLVEVGVRAGTSTDAFTVLSPNTPLHPAPYAQFARLAEAAELATSVANDSVFSSDIVDGAVTGTKLADGAVGNAKIATGAITLAKMADASVDTNELVNSAVTNAKIASGSILPSRLAGDFNTYPLSLSVSANTCVDVNISPGGDVQQNDIPLLTLASNGSLPNNMSATALRVNSDHIVETRFCNYGGTTASFSNLPFRLITFR